MSGEEAVTVTVTVTAEDNVKGLSQKYGILEKLWSMRELRPQMFKNSLILHNCFRLKAKH